MSDTPTGDIHDRLAWIMARIPVIDKTHMANVNYKAFAIDNLYTQLRHLSARLVSTLCLGCNRSNM